MFKNVFKNKRVLITGHTGFKGSWLSIWLKELGADVMGYALDPYSDRVNFVHADLANQIIDCRGEIRDFDKLRYIIDKYSPEMVFHLAAQPIVRESYHNPKETFDINISGTINLLEACRLSDSIKTIINVTSDKCYENKEIIWGYRENDALGGYDPYSSSKACSEIVSASFRNSFFRPENYPEHGKALATVRAGNVIGGGDWAKDRIIPDCVRSLEKQEDILIRNPKAIRPWQFVLEPLGGYLQLAARLVENPQKYAGAWNFGPTASSLIPVGRLADLVIGAWGEGRWYTEGTTDAPHEDTFLSLDISKACHRLNWRPVYNVEEAVKETIEWYKTTLNVEDQSMYGFCAQQINRYCTISDKMENMNEL